jgi:hypothetical protein
VSKRAELRKQNVELTEWPAYSRPAGRTWQMNPSRRVIYDNQEAKAQAIWKAGQILKMLGRNNVVAKDVCEVGVLSKGIVEDLRKRLGSEASVQGHEVPLQELELNDCRADPVLREFLHDITSTHPGAFDVFMILDVMEHIENYHGFLRAARPLGKWKLIHLPMDLTVHTIFRQEALTTRRQTFLHISYFTKDTIMRVLEDCGYEVIDYLYTPWRIDFGTELSARLMRIPRRLLFRLSPDTAVRLLGGYSLLILAR